MFRYGLTIFLSAMLLFQVQPLIARVILPWFGGTSSVWTTCMLFFQTGLLLGYCYVHILRNLVSAKSAWWIHSCLLVIAVLYSSPVPHTSLQPSGNQNLTFSILGILVWTIALPFFVLSATGPLIQAWQSLSHPQRSPYPLFALSNLGSMLALLSYPFFMELYFSTDQQGSIWQFGFLAFCILCVVSGWQVNRCRSWEPQFTHEPVRNLERDHRTKLLPFVWILMSMTGSTVLLATTNLMCQEVASVPMLWIIPLSLYLLSFIVCFEYRRAYQRWIFIPVLALSAIVAVLVVHLNVHAGISLQIGSLVAVCFAATMTCHGELERLKPEPQKLTLFYLMIAVGGASGGILVAICAPVWFDGFYEFQIGLLISLTIPLIAICRESRQVKQQDRKSSGVVGQWLRVGVLMLAISIVGSSLYFLINSEMRPHRIYRERNAYGTLAVEEVNGYRKFIHGQIEHGGQFIDNNSTNHSSYYPPGSGVAVAVSAFREYRNSITYQQANARSLNVGVIGLGIGGMLGWSETGDEFTFYELNPAVERVAKEFFTFLADSPAKTKIILGDGRFQLQHRAAGGLPNTEKFDLLFLDAFSSDAIPIHLMTEEAFSTYIRNLKPDGILIAHITNRFVDLRPIVYHHAIKNEMSPILVETELTETSQRTRWVLMTRNAFILETQTIQQHRVPWPTNVLPIRWTDSRSSLMDVINWSGQVDWFALKKARDRDTNQPVKSR